MLDGAGLKIELNTDDSLNKFKQAQAERDRSAKTDR